MTEHDNDSELGPEQQELLGAIRQFASVVEESANPWPSHIDGYVILGELGSGGQSDVLLAFDQELQRQVVIKLFHESTAAAREQILGEGRTLARIRHPSVATCFATGEYGGRPYLVLEHLDGTPLAAMTVPAVPADAKRLLGRIADGLAAVHAEGVAHGDVKPSNIIVDREGNPRLIDFGLVMNVDDEPTVSSLGTVAYMAPERARGEATMDPRQCDVFSLGGVLYFLLTGKAPFESATKTHSLELARAGVVVPAHEVNPAAPIALSDLCQRCLAPASRRIGLIGEFIPLLASARTASSRTRNILVTAVLGVAIVLSCWAAFMNPDDPAVDKDTGAVASPVTFIPPIVDIRLRLMEAMNEDKPGRVKPGILSSDIPLTVRIEPSREEGGVLQFTEDDSARITVSSDVPFALTIIGMSSVSKPYIFYPRPDQRDDFGLSKEHIARTGFANPEGIETFYFLATTQKREFKLIDEDFAEPTRGTNRNDLLTEHIVKYEVIGVPEPAEGQSEQEQAAKQEDRSPQSEIAELRKKYAAEEDAEERHDQLARITLTHAYAGEFDKAMDVVAEWTQHSQKPWHQADVRLAAEYVRKLQSLPPKSRDRLRLADRQASEASDAWDVADFLKMQGPMQAAQAARTELLGKDHWLTLEIDELAAQFAGRVEGKLQFCYSEINRILKAKQKIFSEPHNALNSPRYVLSLMYSRMGQEGQAESLAKFVVDSRTKMFGADSFHTARARSHYGDLIMRQGRILEAREEMLRCVTVFRREGDRAATNLAWTLSDLAFIHGERNDIDTAVELANESITIGERPETNTPPGNLVGDYRRLIGYHLQAEDAAKARAALTRLTPVMKNVQEPHYHADFLSLTAQVLVAEGNYDEGIAAHRKALDMIPEQFPRDRLVPQDMLADAMMESGKHLAEAVAIRKTLPDQFAKGFGAGHPSTVAAIHNLAYALFTAGDNAGAAPHYEKALTLAADLADRELSGFAEAQRYMLTQNVRRALSGLLLTATQVPDDKLYEYMWRVKGIATQSLMADRRWAQESALRAELARLFTADPSSARKLSARRMEIRNLLGNAASENAVVPQQTVADLVGALPEGTALVDIFVADPEVTNVERQYVAFVVRDFGDGVRAKRVNLGPVVEIDKVAVAWRTSLVDEKARLRGTRRLPGGKLPATDLQVQQKVWAPIGRLLEGAQKVLIAPDGALSMLPWAALPGKAANASVLQDYADVRVISSARSLLREPGAAPDKPTLLAIAASSDQPAKAGAEQLLRGGLYVQDLLPTGSIPGAVEEVKQVTADWKARKVSIALADLNTDRIRTELPRATHFHFAGHALFMHETLQKLPPQQRAFVKRNPYVLTGLVLPNRTLLSGEEILSLDLRNLRLAVLSACETAIGETVSGEGVMGLQRAFHIAGTQYVLASLWRVEDKSTQRLMTEFWTNLRAGENPHRALRRAQVKMLTGAEKKYQAPYYWAGWTLTER